MKKIYVTLLTFLLLDPCFAYPPKDRRAVWQRLELIRTHSRLGEAQSNLALIRTRAVLDKLTTIRDMDGNFLGVFVHTTELKCDGIQVMGAADKSCHGVKKVHLEKATCVMVGSDIEVTTTWTLCQKQNQIQAESQTIRGTYSVKPVFP